MHRQIALPGDWERWLPPPPYDEMVRDFLLHARATLVWEDPARPPLLACEDGGMIPLPLVRYDEGRRFHSAEDPQGATVSQQRLTRFSDVCASVDRMKAIWLDTEAITPAEWAEINVLLDDALYMISRLGRRHGAYDQAAIQLGELVARLQQVDTPDPPPADEAAEDLRDLIENAEGQLSRFREDLDRLAEAIRDVAQRQEDRARDKKELWLRIHALYEQVRGLRNWDEDETRVAGDLPPP